MKLEIPASKLFKWYKVVEQILKTLDGPWRNVYINKEMEDTLRDIYSTLKDRIDEIDRGG
ncbi:MAG: hypothetical protein J7K33_09840 [Candidatus Marinimicrobia bacterium]|nr:hypothetical protein [Candidatus Neomarinimicrobiota bacterium]